MCHACAGWLRHHDYRRVSLAFEYHSPYFLPWQEVFIFAAGLGQVVGFAQ